MGGIPYKNVSADWDDIWNDVCLVACKSEAVRDKWKDRIMFPVERRYDPIKNLVAQDRFLFKWLKEKDGTDDLIIDFIKRRSFDKIYIVGCGTIGTLLSGLFQSRGYKYEVIKTEERAVAENVLAESGILSDTDAERVKGKRVLYILTVLDIHKSQAEEMKRLYAPSAVFYIDDLVKIATMERMKEYFRECADVYIYGAGVNGRHILEILKRYQFEIAGFVLSDDRYKKNHDNIYKISEISNQSGIIISPNDDREIRKILDKLDFTYVFDGKLIL